MSGSAESTGPPVVAARAAASYRPTSRTHVPARRDGRRFDVADLDDATLAARARDGSPRSFELLVLRYQGPVFRLALRILTDREEAEDVTQEVFVTAWRRLPELRDDVAFAAWLYRTATTRSLNLVRGRRFTDVLPVELRSNRPTDSPVRRAESNAAAADLEIALGVLPAGQRACWLLREVHGLGYEDIAAAVGSTPTTVRGRIARARYRLAEAMSPWR